MADFIHLVKLGNAKIQKVSKRTPRGTFKHAESTDKLVYIFGLMDTSAVYFIDTAYGYDMIDIDRRQKGSADTVRFPVPKAVDIYNKFMGGVDELDRLRMGDHGFEGRGRAFKWTNRFFDAMVNLLFQASYRIYKHCRDRKEGNEPFLTHSQFNEKVIDYYLNNNAWKLEKELLASGKRISIRKVVEQSNSFQNVDVNFATHHDMVENTATWSDGRISSYFCAFCQMNPPDEPLTYKHRSKFYCEQCSIFADFTADRVYLHPQCFGKYHRHKYDRIVGSTNVTGVVLGK